MSEIVSSGSHDNQGRPKAMSSAKWTDELRTTLVVVLVDRTNMVVSIDNGSARGVVESLCL